MGFLCLKNKAFLVFGPEELIVSFIFYSSYWTFLNDAQIISENHFQTAGLITRKENEHPDHSDDTGSTFSFIFGFHNKTISCTGDTLF